MSIYDVGAENLPNVYIDNILIEYENQTLDGNIKIFVDCLMNDHYPSRSWFDRTEMAGLKVKVAMVYDQDLANQLITGVVSLFDLTEFFTDRYSMQFDNASAFVEASVSLTTTLAPTTQQFYKRFTFERRTFAGARISSSSTVFLFAACYLDNLGFENALFNKYYGPMVAEKVLTNGEVNTKTRYFYFVDTNEEYGGPVHAHEGRFMDGSRHRQEAHNFVRPVIEDNTKISLVYVDENIDVLAETGGGPSVPQTSMSPSIQRYEEEDILNTGGIQGTELSAAGQLAQQTKQAELPTGTNIPNLNLSNISGPGGGSGGGGAY